MRVTCNGNKNKLCLSISQVTENCKKKTGAAEPLRNILKHIKVSNKVVVYVGIQSAFVAF